MAVLFAHRREEKKPTKRRKKKREKKEKEIATVAPVIFFVPGGRTSRCPRGWTGVELAALQQAKK